MDGFEMPEIEVQAGVSNERLIALVIAFLVAVSIAILMFKLAK